MDIINYFESPKPDLKGLAKRVYTKALWADIKTKPETEQECFKYQYDYFTADTAEERGKAWTALFQVLLSYSKSLILQKLKRKTFLEPEEVYEKSLQATTAFLSCYIINYEFFVGASFAGYLNYKIIEVLYKPKDEDRTLSLDFSFKGSDTEYSFIEDGLRLGTKLLYGDDYEDPSMTIRQGPYEIIEEEISHYEGQFKDKVVLCNCDDPFESNFCYYFLKNFCQNVLIFKTR